MTLNRFALPTMRQAALAAVLLAGLWGASVSAVELVGKPVAISSSASVDSSLPPIDEEVGQGQQGQNDPLQGESEWPSQPGSVDAAVPLAKQPFGINKHIVSDEDNALVQLAAMAFCLGGPILLIIVLVSMHYRAKERRAKNINANIERLLAAGRDIPIELLRGDEPYAGPESALVRDDLQMQKGIRNLCLGLGLIISLTIMFGFQFGAIGFIVLSLGVSQLWLWKLSGSKQDKIQNQG